METFFRNGLTITPQEWLSSSIFIIDFEHVYDTSFDMIFGTRNFVHTNTF